MHNPRKYFKADFSVFCTYLASEIAHIFSERDPGSHKYRTYGRDTSKKCGSKRLIAAAESGGHQYKKVKKYNGVDISNTSRYYSPYGWNKLCSATKYKLLSDPKRIAAKEKRASDKKTSMNVSSSSVTATAKYDKESAATINTVVKSLKLSFLNPAREGSVCFPANGSNANVSVDRNGASAVTQIFDHNRDPI